MASQDVYFYYSIAATAAAIALPIAVYFYSRKASSLSVNTFNFSSPGSPAMSPKNDARLNRRASVAGFSFGSHAPASGIWQKLHQVERQNKVVYRIVLTGGPCAGKSTAAVMLQEQLEAQGFFVCILPEIATLMFTAGANWSDFASTPAGLSTYQLELAKLQVAQEDSFEVLGDACPKNAVIICDRGILDGKAYCTPEVWKDVLKGLGVGENELLSRYDAVLHLVTAAEGAEEFYTKDNNAARRESPADARKVDLTLRQCWQHHPHLTVVDNNLDFAKKMESVANAVLDNINGTHSKTRKYILLYKTIEECRQDLPKDVHAEIETVKEIRTNNGTVFRSRHRGECSAKFYMEEKMRIQRTVVERTMNITEAEYQHHLAVAGLSAEDALEKVSLLFRWQDEQWAVYHSLSIDQLVLSVKNESPKLPDFLNIGKEVVEESDKRPSFLRAESQFHLS